ncbi:MAG: DUF2842 domain-containing protein [Pseudoprimorskyibacter sp.]|jgi:hypothetical protein|nr:DUF2842 domain-containing protein [Pseudoprimorskyibacter sp.]
MSLSYAARRRWALVVLLVGLPIYIAAALFTVSLFDRPSILVELLVYIVLGIVWAAPFKMLFRGVGQDDPNAPNQND